MSNPLRNAMVYFGLAEEDEAANATQRPASQTNVTDRVSDFDEFDAPAAPVTPISTKTPTRVASKPAAAAPVAAPRPVSPNVGAMNEILTVHPKAYDKDAQLIAESFRDGVPVIMNLSQMTDADARRIIDFASGLTQGLSGKIERVTNRVFLLTPENISVHGEATAGNNDATFLM
ncbi:cell division protein SepF [Gulosibacter bifidus]|uniref:Cell division protein SepF n=1 Tax=Gulosibacter bifidus TaxID=272239 RepID=A0ABW5RGN1_9MICO|nr:cell division protein SepF [Gulosibacter bifidus]